MGAIAKPINTKPKANTEVSAPVKSKKLTFITASKEEVEANRIKVYKYAF